MCVYLHVILQVFGAVRQVSSHNQHKHVHALGAEFVHVLWAGQQRRRVNHSQHEVRLRPLPSEILLEISAEELEVLRYRKARNAEACLEFLSTCPAEEFINK